MASKRDSSVRSWASARGRDGQVSQLVQAMATYAANNPGFDPTSSSIHTVPNDAGLQSTMSAAWHA